MAHADFIHLRVRTAYSLLEGAIRLDELVETCRDWRMPACAIADRGNMFGALAFSEACRAAGRAAHRRLRPRAGLRHGAAGPAGPGARRGCCCWPRTRRATAT